VGDGYIQNITNTPIGPVHRKSRNDGGNREKTEIGNPRDNENATALFEKHGKTGVGTLNNGTPQILSFNDDKEEIEFENLKVAPSKL
jgi:hypothetical protein